MQARAGKGWRVVLPSPPFYFEPPLGGMAYHRTYPDACRVAPTHGCAIINAKGGAGKTTLALHLAVADVQQGRNVAVLDLDPQGTAAGWGERRGSSAPVVLATAPSRFGAERERERGAGAGADVGYLDTPPRWAGADTAARVAPYGFQFIDGRREWHQGEQETLAAIHEHRRAGLSWAKVADKLNTAGHRTRTRTGGQWTRQGAHQVHQARDREPGGPLFRQVLKDGATVTGRLGVR